jgi:hypothetical protein
MPINAYSQTPELPGEAFDLYPTLRDMHGYAVGMHQDKILIFGGLIRSELPDLYPDGFPNQELLLIDLGRRRATAFSSGGISDLLGEQLAAYGLAFHQLDQTLYIVGGYGLSRGEGAFVTFPYIISVDVPAVIADLLAGQNPEAHFRQHCDDRMALFNAILDHNGQEFFLLGGKRAVKRQLFSREPDYREEAPEEQLRTFRLRLQNDQLQVEGYQGWYDLGELEAVYGNQIPPKIRRAMDKPDPPQ